MHDDDEPGTVSVPAARSAPLPLPDTSVETTELSVTYGTETAGADRTLHSDPHDFAGLYLRHRWSFTLHARRYLRDERDADEVVQEAFLRLFLALPELETELQALAYCRRTLTNLCIDRYRTQARRPRLVHLESVPLEEIPDEDTGDPVVRAEDAAIVREALSLLSPMHRAALVMREIEEMPLPVIADQLEIPEENVKHLLFRARRALRRLLAGTSLAPGQGGEAGRGLGATARAGSGGLAGLLLALVLGIGSGPNLEAIPVVGVDLPDVIGVTALAKTVGTAVTGAVGAVSAPGREDAAGDGGAVAGSPDPAPLRPTSPSAGAAAAAPAPVPATAAPAPVAATAAPAPAAAATAAPTPVAPAAAPEPEVVVASPARPAAPPLAAPTAEVSDGEDGASPSPEAIGSPQPTRTPSPGPSGSPSSSPAASPTPAAAVATGAEPTPTASPGRPPSAGPSVATATAPVTGERLPGGRSVERTGRLPRSAEVPGPWR